MLLDIYLSKSIISIFCDWIIVFSIFLCIMFTLELSITLSSKLISLFCSKYYILSINNKITSIYVCSFLFSFLFRLCILFILISSIFIFIIFESFISSNSCCNLIIIKSLLLIFWFILSWLLISFTCYLINSFFNS